MESRLSLFSLSTHSTNCSCSIHDYFLIIGTPCLQSPTTCQPAMPLLRSVTVAGDRRSSIMSDSLPCHNDNTLDQSEPNEPKLRTFRGWKRNTAQLDKSRFSKSLWLSQVNISL